jgi:hypothetical protein
MSDLGLISEPHRKNLTDPVWAAGDPAISPARSWHEDMQCTGLAKGSAI